MYEYRTVKASNEKWLEKLVNELAAEDWEVVSYAIRPSGGFFLFIVGLLAADHFAMLRRPKA